MKNNLINAISSMNTTNHRIQHSVLARFGQAPPLETARDLKAGLTQTKTETG